MATRRNKRTDAATNGNEVETTWLEDVARRRGGERNPSWPDWWPDTPPTLYVTGYEISENGTIASISVSSENPGNWRDEEADAMPGCPPGCPGNCPPGCCGFQFGPDDPDLQSPLGLA